MTHSIVASPVLEAPAGIAGLDDIPILYEDEEEEDMGEANYHVETDKIFHVCLSAHLAARHPDLRAFSNMNLYYKKDGPPHPVTKSLPYVSPDGMVVRPYRPLPRLVPSYTIGSDGPAPVLSAEILSPRSTQQRDLQEKMVVYAKLGVPEYILIDMSGKHLRQKLLLKRLQPDGNYRDERDPDGGVTSVLGFREIIDVDDEIRLLDTATEKPYVRPMELPALTKELRMAELRALAASEARQEAEQNRAVASEALRQAEEHVRQEAEARRLAVEQAHLAEEQARQAVEQAHLAEEQARQAEEQARQAEEHVRQAVEHVRQEAEARRLAEERIQDLQAELERLRRQTEKPNP